MLSFSEKQVLSKTETEAWMHGTNWQLSEGRRGGCWMKDGEGIRQKTSILIKG